MKQKHALQICIPANFFINNYCIVTRTLKINLELNNKFPDKNEKFRKNKQNPEKIYM